MSYLDSLLGTSLLLLILVASLNYFTDPGSVYHGDRLNSETFSIALINSKHGLWWPKSSWEERSLKKALAKQAYQADCVVIGSSHAMEISSHRENKSLTDNCLSLLNLSVSGASIEDHITLTYLALQNVKPKKLILGIDPWTMAFGTDVRWAQYENDYYRARSAVQGKENTLNTKRIENGIRDKITNLFSFEYTVRSLDTVLRYVRNGLPSIVEAPRVNDGLGGDNAVILPDGSLIYSAQYILEAKYKEIPWGGEGYKTTGLVTQYPAIDAYRSLISWIKNNNVEPIFLLTPYHQNVWKIPNSPDAVALNNIEPVVRNLATEFGVKTIGSYNAEATGCLPDEFWDIMHPTSKCLMKLHSIAQRDIRVSQ